MLVVSVWFDKSDLDFVSTMRPCNWKKGNVAAYVRCVCCLEGPVVENYKNEVKTARNKDFPVKSTIQSMVDDTLFALVLSSKTSGKNWTCLCFVFEPVPTFDQCEKHLLISNLIRTVVPDEGILWYTPLIMDNTPNVSVQLESLITCKDDPLIVVGLQFSKGGETFAIGN